MSPAADPLDAPRTRDDEDDPIVVFVLRRSLVAVVVLLAATLSASAVLLSSRAAFTASLDNDGNSLRTTTVTLTADVTSALFDVTGMIPGDSEQRCVEVTYDGTLVTPSEVRLYVGGMTDPAGLASHLGVVVVEGAAGTTCDGGPSGTVVLDATLAAAAATHVDHTSGTGSWVPAASPAMRPYHVTLTLDRGAPSRLSGSRIDDLELVWEVTS